MGKRKSTLLSLGALFFAFMLSTLFFYMVYNMHFDSASDDFTGMTVMGASYENEPGQQREQNLGMMREELTTWASENHAILFYKGFSAAGIAAVDYAGWFAETWDVSFTGQQPKTALIQRTRSNVDSYAGKDVLFPGVYNYRIVGEINGQNSPTFQGDAFFYYPLQDITGLEGMLYTNVADETALASLNQIIEKTGRQVEFQTYDDSRSSILDVIVKMFRDDFVSRSMLFTFFGILFCAVFAVYMMYRESNRYLAIHHLYGATYRSLFMKILLKLIAVALLGTLLGYLLAKTQLNLIHRAAYIRVAVLSGLCNVLFAGLVQVLCFSDWKQKQRRQKEAY